MRQCEVIGWNMATENGEIPQAPSVTALPCHLPPGGRLRFSDSPFGFDRRIDCGWRVFFTDSRGTPVPTGLEGFPWFRQTD